MKKIKSLATILALAATLGSTATFAQNDMGAGTTTTAAAEDDRPNYTPLLGLLGLLGLMGLKRRHDNRDYADARR